MKYTVLVKSWHERSRLVGSTQNLGAASHGRSREIHFGPCGRQKISGVLPMGDHGRFTLGHVVAKKSRGYFPWEIT
jgi:hypothetical protein